MSGFQSAHVLKAHSHLARTRTSPLDGPVTCHGASPLTTAAHVGCSTCGYGEWCYEHRFESLPPTLSGMDLGVASLTQAAMLCLSIQGTPNHLWQGCAIFCFHQQCPRAGPGFYCCLCDSQKLEIFKERAEANPETIPDRVPWPASPCCHILGSRGPWSKENPGLTPALLVTGCVTPGSYFTHS